MKILLIPTTLALAAVLSGAPASAAPGFFPGTHRLIRGITPIVHRPIIRGVAYHPKHPIYGIVLRSKYMIRGIVVSRAIDRSIVLGPQVRGVPVERGF